MTSEVISLDAPPPNEASPKRRQVVQAARPLFLAHGYGAVSMDMVARTAGVSKATLYAYFPSKDVLFATMMRESCLLEALDEALFPEQAAGLRAALEAIGQRVLRFMLREGTLAIHRMAIAESARFPELGRAFYANGPRRSLERLRAWLELQQAEGLVRPADLDVAAEQLMAMLRSGLFLRASLGLQPPPGDAEIDRAVAAAVETWLRAYAADPAA